MLLLLGSCHEEQLYPPVEPWLCSINADGTGFRKIKKVDLSFGTTGFWDIYMTKDNRIIFYGEKLWITETDTIRFEQITPNNLVLFDFPQLEFTRDGSTAYFAASRDLYKLKLSTNELFKITVTPEDYTYAEPLLSDDERYLTMRSFNAKEPRIVGAYIDIQDNTLRYIFSNLWFPASYKTKIMTSMNSMILENRDGFASVNLQDSTYTLHQLYLASYKNMFETSADQHYLLTKYIQSSKSYAIAIDLQNYTRYELGYVNEHHSRSPIKVCKDANFVFYFDDHRIYKYDLNTHQKSTVIEPNANCGLLSIIMLAPTWDGSKVYLYADLAEK
jgi:hypothetical protein